jgi:hypothetical protein
MGGNQPHQEARRGARIAHVERRSRLQQRADTDAVDAPFAFAGALDAGAHGAHGGGGGQHVLALEQAANPRLAHGQRAQHDRAVADRLVAGHADLALEGPGGQEAARCGGGIGGGGQNQT